MARHRVAWYPPIYRPVNLAASMRLSAILKPPKSKHRRVIALYYLGEPEQRRSVTRWKHARALEYMAGRLRGQAAGQ